MTQVPNEQEVQAAIEDAVGGEVEGNHDTAGTEDAVRFPANTAAGTAVDTSADTADGDAAGDDADTPAEGGRAKIKKKPGRPRKQNIHIPIAVHGIVEKPAHEVDLIELIYSDPMLFKKYIALLKGYGVGEIELNFDKNGLRIDTKNRVNTVDISTVLSGACMNLYYCKEPIRIWVKRTALELVVNTLSKNHSRITWVLRENYREMLYIIVKNSSIGSDQIFEVEVFSKAAQIPPIVPDDDSAYPIRFRISTKYFKKAITTVSKDAKRFTIQKNGAQPLQLTIGRSQGSNVGWTEVYQESDKISLQSQIANDDIFNVSVEISNILAFCKYALGDDIYVAADKEKRIMFQCFADRKEIGWTISVKIFSNIVGAANALLVHTN